MFTVYGRDSEIPHTQLTMGNPNEVFTLKKSIQVGAMNKTHMHNITPRRWYYNLEVHPQAKKRGQCIYERSPLNLLANARSLGWMVTRLA